MRLIDLDKLLQYPLRSGSTLCDEEEANAHFLAGVDSVLEWAQTLPTFIRQSEWISVEDALPPDSADGLSFICMTDIPGRFGGVTPLEWQVACIRGKTVRRWRWMDRICPWRVSHWMLLPKPPEREGDA